MGHKQLGGGSQSTEELKVKYCYMNELPVHLMAVMAVPVLLLSASLPVPCELPLRALHPLSGRGEWAASLL